VDDARPLEEVEKLRGLALGLGRVLADRLLEDGANVRGERELLGDPERDDRLREFPNLVQRAPARGASMPRCMTARHEAGHRLGRASYDVGSMTSSTRAAVALAAGVAIGLGAGLTVLSPGRSERSGSAPDG